MNRWRHSALRLLFFCGGFALSACTLQAQADAGPTTFKLNGEPSRHLSGNDTTKPTDSLVGGRRVERWSDVADATVTWFPAANPDGRAMPAVLVIPGGGYRLLATDLEGTEACAWLNAQGVSALLLRYRVPTDPPHKGPLADARAALALLQKHAAEWHVDTAQVGAMGFSAGAHLAGRLAVMAPQGTLKALLLIYPAYFAGKGDDVAAVPFASATPPTFVVQAQDDDIGVINATTIFAQLKAVKVPTELHIFPFGGHGYGLRPSPAAVSVWPELAAGWLARQGFVRGAK